MNRKEILLLLIAYFLVGIGWVYAQPQPGSPWPMIHHDQYHTGRSPYNGPETPTLKWSFDTGYEIVTSPAIAEDSTIYIDNVDEYLYAISPDGSEKWRFSVGDAVESSPAIGFDGTIYVGNNISNFYAINPDGSEKWTYDMGMTLTWPSPTISQDGRIYQGTMGNGTIYALNPDGSEVWNYSIGVGKWFYDAPSIDPNGNIYIQSNNGYLYALSSAGSYLWDYYISQSGGKYRPRSSYSVEDSSLYTGGMDDTFYALSPDGTL